MTDRKPGDVWYSFHDYATSAGSDEYGEPYPWSGGVGIRCHNHFVKKVTPKGVRFTCGRVQLDASGKKYACPTKEEARVSFLARKRRQIAIHQSRILQAQNAIKAIDSKLYSYLFKPDELVVPLNLDELAPF